MKVVYNNPVLVLTDEEKSALNRAIAVLSSICDKTEDYPQCECKCPIYEHCPYHHDFNQLGYTLQHILSNIVSEAEREEE
jgi:hypothetical protein